MSFNLFAIAFNSFKPYHYNRILIVIISRFQIRVSWTPEPLAIVQNCMTILASTVLMQMWRRLLESFFVRKEPNWRFCTGRTWSIIQNNWIMTNCLEYFKILDSSKILQRNARIAFRQTSLRSRIQVFNVALILPK